MPTMSPSYLQPKSMGRVVPCPGSLALEAQHPEKADSPAAMDDGATHWMADQMLEGHKGDLIGIYPFEYLDTKAENGRVLTHDLIDCADQYVMHCMGLCQQTGGLNAFESESLLVAPGVHKDLWGDADFDLFDQRETAHLVAMKTSYKAVDILDNWELITFAIGQAFKYPTAQIFRTAIVQPRAFHTLGSIRLKAYKRAELEAHAVTLQNAITVALSPNAPYQSGPHCYKCRGMAVCPAGREAAMAGSDVAMSGGAEVSTAIELGQELFILEEAYRAIKERRTAKITEAEARMEGGEYIPGCEIAIGRRGNRAWEENAPLEVIGCGIDLYERAPVSPTMAEKRGVPKAVVDLYVKRSAGKRALQLTNYKQISEAFKDGKF